MLPGVGHLISLGLSCSQLADCRGRQALVERSQVCFDFCVSVLGVSEGVLKLYCLHFVCGGSTHAIGAEEEVRGPLVSSLLPCGWLED